MEPVVTMEIVVLGSSGSFASADNPCTGYLVQTPESSVLLDCGPGTLGPLQRAIDLPDLTAVVVTHNHPDHWLELPVLRNVFKYFHQRVGIPLYGTAATKRMDDALTVRDGATSSDPFVWNVINAESAVTIGDQAWTFRRTDHPVETLAVRVDCEGRSFVFTSDTGPAWSIEDFGPGVDLALYDASHLSAFEGMGIPHTSAREAGERCRAAGVGRMVATHLVPGSDPEAHRAEASAAYGDAVDIAGPGDRFVV
jgi:ribonuclease BN (tRNA processing enzyme)